MRIISGSFKGRRLSPTDLKFTRPTTDFAREGIFNILNNRLEWEGMKILDLYSGSGAVAIEFISRGVAQAVAVDNQIQCVKFISEIQQKWNLENLEVIKSDALKYLENCHYTFDLIYADPPYQSDYYNDILKLVFDRELLTPSGDLILEHEKRKSFESHQYFEFQRAFGNVNFSIFCPSNN